ncbi:DUF4251 domain-containing protein [Mucilaginibacter psychrotolerans]|uniref:DUF4251 domain-containing protein n=1 Tax=Mucilaginibacter psychrotolerans TaxID=1524096 RepID=A0A4Y8SKW6_9SPHI|nr:DUF4251 domain-containing protein [Mucilaginibacter psychrotolerans]TFF39693.1 DUF4251 domain-containing protein [Mucilaginibacter psychrotolerans]
MKTLIKICISLAIIASFTQTGLAQDKKAEKLAEVKQLIQSKNYLFKAEFMLPMGGAQQYLTSDYDLKITPDTLVAYLPYFGVVYFNAAYNNSADAGIQFTSTRFDYKLEERKNGGYYVYIKPKDTKNTQQMILDVSANGGAGLTVQSVNRQMIRFTGYIKEVPKPKI